MISKICKKCKTDKPVAEFCKDKSKSDGLASYCHFCNNEKAVQWRAANKEKVHLHNVAYREKQRKLKGIEISHAPDTFGIQKTERGFVHLCANQPCRSSDGGQRSIRSRSGTSSLEFVA